MEAIETIGQSKTYDLEERTAVFGEEIITLCKFLPPNTITNPIIDQLMRSGTSIGANYAESNGASSRRDFRNKILIVKRECQETKYWLRMLAKAVPGAVEHCRRLWKECQELTLIFGTIAVSSSRQRKSSTNSTRVRF